MLLEMNDRREGGAKIDQRSHESMTRPELRKGRWTAVQLVVRSQRRKDLQREQQ